MGDLLRRNLAAASGTVSRLAYWALVASACVAAAGTAVTVSPAAAATSEIWGNAQEIAGLAQLNVGYFAQLNSVSCSSPGDCGAGGTYTDASGPQALVVSEQGGAWGAPQQVPGTAALNVGGWAVIASVSCASPGNCGAGGFYTDASNHRQAFVVTETGGTWGTAQEVPGTAAMNVGPDAEVTSVSCASPGTCSAGRFYTGATNQQGGFVVDETGGTWGTAQQMPGSGFPAGSSVTAVSCGAPGDCTAGGTGFVATEAGGIWGPAEALPGASGPSAGLGGEILSLSCVSQGNCEAGGDFNSSSSTGVSYQALVADETSGSWGNAQEVPGIASLNAGLDAHVTSVWCTSPGDCTAGGYYAPSSTNPLELQPFVVTETSGTWDTAQPIPGMGTLNAGGVAEVTSVSCASPGDCAAGGYYYDARGHQQAFVDDEISGTWDTVQEVPGTAALNAGGYASVSSMSCVTGDDCSAVGYFQGNNGDVSAFVVGREPTVTTSTVMALSTGNVVYGAEQAEHVTVTVSAPSGQAPAGKVVVTSGSTTVCTITLASGTGSCTPTTTKFAAGRVTVTASYRGNVPLSPSVSAAASFTVSKARSTSSLALSATRVRYGKEHAVRLTVRVAPQYAGTPTGAVTIKSGTRTVCTVRLASGAGSCKLSPRDLPVGRHRLVATYPGSGNFSRSVSAGRYLTVTK